MNGIKQSLEERIRYLDQIIRKTEKYIDKLPEGYLRASWYGSGYQYYHRKGPYDRRGKYIKKENRDLAEGLAQKHYYLRVKEAAIKEESALRNCLGKYPEITAEEIYGDLTQGRKDLVIPLEKTDEMVKKEWVEVKYKGKGFFEDEEGLKTEKGERVRSKSELLIADMLVKNNILYRYECPVRLKGLGKVYPDFTVLNIRERREYYWEHFGMMGKPEYAVKAVNKINTYIKNGYYPGKNLIITYETENDPLDTYLIKMVIEEYLI